MKKKFITSCPPLPVENMQNGRLESSVCNNAIAVVFQCWNRLWGIMVYSCGAHDWNIVKIDQRKWYFAKKTIHGKNHVHVILKTDGRVHALQAELSTELEVYSKLKVERDNPMVF